MAGGSYFIHVIHTYDGWPSSVKIAIPKLTGMIYSAELTPCIWFLWYLHQKLTRLPAIGAAQPMLVANEPFRFTPNMQEFFMMDAGIEGLLTPGINAIARCFTEPEVRMFSFPCVH